MRSAHRKLLRGVELLGTPLIPPAHADARLKIFWTGGGGRLNRRRNPDENSHDNEDQGARAGGTGGDGRSDRLLRPSRRDDVRRETRRNAGNLEIGFNSTMLASKASA